MSQLLVEGKNLNMSQLSAAMEKAGVSHVQFSTKRQMWSILAHAQGSAIAECTTENLEWVLDRIAAQYRMPHGEQSL